MIETLLPVLRTPADRIAELHVLATAPTERSGAGLLTATLTGPRGEDPSQVRDGIWEALGQARPQRTAAQLTNSLPMSPWFYESTWRSGAMSRFSGRPFPIAEELAEMDRAVGDVDGRIVVDIGCSEGLYSRHLARRGASVLAIDHSRAYCRKARRRAAKIGVRIAVARAVAQNLPVADGMSDAAVMGGTLNEIGDREAALNEMGRILRPAGRAYVVSLLPARSAPGRLLQRGLGLTGIHFPSLAETNDLFSRAGLTVEDQRVEGVTVRSFLSRSSRP